MANGPATATMRLQIAAQRPHWSRQWRRWLGRGRTRAKCSAPLWYVVDIAAALCPAPCLPAAAAAEWRPDCLGNNAYREKYCIYVQQQLLTLGISWHQLRIERLYRGLIPPPAGPVFPSLALPANHSLFWATTLQFKIQN